MVVGAIAAKAITTAVPETPTAAEADPIRPPGPAEEAEYKRSPRISTWAICSPSSRRCWARNPVISLRRLMVGVIVP